MNKNSVTSPGSADERFVDAAAYTVAQLHRRLLQALERDFQRIRVEGRIVGIHNTQRLLVLDIADAHARRRERPIITAPVRRSARHSIEELWGHISGAFLGSFIVADLELRIGKDIELRPLIREVLQVVPIWRD
jgi:hypothetical protein